jgi:hypothetical protein
MSAQTPNNNILMNLPALVAINKASQKFQAKAAAAADKDAKSQGGLKDMMSGGLGKLGMITLGVGGILGVAKMFISASPMLKSMLKLFQFGIMLILRPIGDFIGFMLRPIMLMVLTKFILPFYQNALPMMQEMGTMVGEILVPIVEKIVLGVIAFGKIVSGFWLALFTFLNPWMDTDTSLLDQGIAEMQGLFTGVQTTNSNLVTLDNDLKEQSEKQIDAVKTGFADLPKMTDKMKGLSSDMMKFSNTELVKMIGLLGKDNVNGAGVGAANTAVAVASARGDASTMEELKSIWYKTLMNQGGWTKMPDGKEFGQNTAQDYKNKVMPETVNIKVSLEGMDGNYTDKDKYEFKMVIAETVDEVFEKKLARITKFG